MREITDEPLPSPGRAGALERLVAVVLTLAVITLLGWLAAMLCGAFL